MPTGPVPSALTVLELLRANRFDEIQAMFAPTLRTMVTADALRGAWAAEQAKTGAITTIGTPTSEPAGAGSGAELVKVPLILERGALTLLIGVTADGWLTGLQLAPAAAAEPIAPWSAPSYVDESAFDERAVTVGSGRLAVPGTLSVPRGARPHPAVVLLAGSGPHDRDSTMGRNKPLKDLAWGLASRGIAVLRFDKVTFAHRPELTDLHNFTVVEEYLTDAHAAIDLVRAQPEVDPARVYLLGHSQGGSLAPRVAAAAPDLAGVVILAGGAVPIQWAAVRQVRYIASLTPETAALAQPSIDALTRQAEAADRPDLSPSTPDSELPFGIPARYWLDLRDHDPVTVAGGLTQRILIVQGGRDYQVTLADDLARWQAALAGRANVTIRVYDADNHLMFPGHGPSTPAEYEPAQHMDPAVIADVAGWLTSA